MFRNIKMEPNQGRENETYLTKKIQCPDHEQKYVFHCQYPNCEYPYICSNLECLNKHFHQQNKITMTNFNAQTISHMFHEVQDMMYDDSLVENARVLKNYIDGLKESIKNIYNGIRTINQNYDFLKGDSQSLLNKDFIHRVSENNKMYRNTKSELDKLKEKVKMQLLMKDSVFFMRGNLSEFFVNNISQFSWNKCQQIFSNNSSPQNLQHFHQQLQGLTHLIFIFIGKEKIIGSFYFGRYPSLQEASAKDDNSFIFVSSSSKFIKYRANFEHKSHIKVNSNSYISHGGLQEDGLKVNEQGFGNIEYKLPCQTHCNIGSEESQGKMSIEKYMILKLEIQNNSKQNGYD